MLMSEELDSYPIKTRLKPMLDFLKCNFDMLQNKCYQNLFQRIIYILWDQFYEVK